MMKIQIITLQFSWAWFGSRLNKNNLHWQCSSFFYVLLCLKQTRFPKKLLAWWNTFNSSRAKSFWWAQSTPTVIGIRLNWVNVSSKSDWGQMPSCPQEGTYPFQPFCPHWSQMPSLPQRWHISSVPIGSAEPEICNTYIWFHQQICFEYFLEVTNCLLQCYWYSKMLWML